MRTLFLRQKIIKVIKLNSKVQAGKNRHNNLHTILLMQARKQNKKEKRIKIKTNTINTIPG